MNRPKVIELRQTCGACPSQWEGRTDDDRSVYVRYRHGRGYVSIGQSSDDSEFAGVDGETVVEWYGDHGLDGYIDEEAMMARTAHAVDWAQPPRGIAE